MEDRKSAVLVDSYRPVYEFDPNKPGVVTKNGVDVQIRTLSESERITVGEELLRQISSRTGVPVSELRKVVSGIASGQVSTSNVQTNRAGGAGVFLASKPGGVPADPKQNRKARRSKVTLSRRAAKRSRR